mmetsp:Transcript_150629/g.419893  ORF Transcript_150629/g.419893 Transcript_150629/m.419893 type:complete len:208 (+) Transcript_150629:522-1145(+)
MIQESEHVSSTCRLSTFDRALTRMSAKASTVSFFLDPVRSTYQKAASTHCISLSPTVAPLSRSSRSMPACSAVGWGRKPPGRTRSAPSTHAPRPACTSAPACSSSRACSGRGKLIAEPSARSRSLWLCLSRRTNSRALRSEMDTASLSPSKCVIFPDFRHLPQTEMILACGSPHSQKPTPSQRGHVQVIVCAAQAGFLKAASQAQMA